MPIIQYGMILTPALQIIYADQDNTLLNYSIIFHLRRFLTQELQRTPEGKFLTLPFFLPT